jgi:hypothetical protein
MHWMAGSSHEMLQCSMASPCTLTHPSKNHKTPINNNGLCIKLTLYAMSDIK